MAGERVLYLQFSPSGCFLVLAFELNEWSILRLWQDVLMSVYPHDTLVSHARRELFPYDWKEPVWMPGRPHTLCWVEFHRPDLLTLELRHPEPGLSKIRVAKFERSGLYHDMLQLDVYLRSSECVESPSGQQRCLSVHGCGSGPQACEFSHAVAISETSGPVPATELVCPLPSGTECEHISLPGKTFLSVVLPRYEKQWYFLSRARRDHGRPFGPQRRVFHLVGKP